jgi:hypothetical protein
MAATAKKAPAKKSPGTSMVKWDEKFAKYAKEAKSQTKELAQTFAPTVKFGRNSITVNGDQLRENRLDIVILNNCALNAFYKGAWDPDVKTPPDCFAIGTYSKDENDLPVLNPMVPHGNVKHPESAECKTCRQNERGSATTGKGKACGNRMRFALKLAKDVGNDVKAAETAQAVLSPTNVGRFTKYQDEIMEEYGRPLWAVVTQVSSFDDPKTQIRVEFKFVELIDDNETLTQLEKDYNATLALLQQPYESVSDEAKAAAAKPAAKKAGSSGKFVGGKRAK